MNAFPEEYERYYRALELKPGATPVEVRRAYLYLRDLYAKESIVMNSLLEDDLSEQRREEILGEIEEAYSRLMRLVEKKHEEVRSQITSDGEESEISEEISRIEHFSGSTLRNIREKLGVDFYEMELSTKIRVQHLENIEQERFDRLPDEVYLRGYLTSYAKYLSLDPQRVVSEYMSGYKNWKESG